MKSMNYTIAIAVFAALVVVLAPQARATTLFSYDFNNLTPVTLPSDDRNLEGQDNWQNWSTRTGSGWSATYPGLQVVQSQQPAVNNTIVVKNPIATGGNQADWRPITPVAFTSADTAVEQYVDLMVDKNASNYTGTIYAGFVFTNTRLGYGAMIANSRINASVAGHVTNGQQSFYMVPNNYALDGTSTNRMVYVSTELAEVGHWYTLKGVMDFSYHDTFSNTEGQVTWYKKDLTAGDTDYSPITFSRYDVSGTTGWHYDNADVTSVPLGLTPVDGKFTIDGINMFTQKYGTADYIYADNFSLGGPISVPEPSTLALLAAGLIGLLAYAWRKRK